MPNRVADFLKKNWILIFILVVATVLRFYKLGTLPPGLHPDEAANGLDVIGMIDQGKFSVIFDTNGPREGLFLYLQGFFVWLGKFFSIESLHYTSLALRIAPAIIGVVTVFGIYKLAKEFFNKNVALFASAALAVSSWHIQFSRNGFRAIMTPLILVFLFYFFIRAYRNGKLKDYIWSGVFLALGFYTYLSFRMIPLVFLALIIYILMIKKKFFSANVKNLAYFIGVFFICMIPMIFHFINVPADILGRASTSIFGQEQNPFFIFGDNIVKTAQMFNFVGDANYRHNVASLPMLEPIIGVLFWVGLILALFKIKKIEYFILIVSLAVLSLPELLTGEGIPHALRLVGIIPVVFILSGLGFEWFIALLKKVGNVKFKFFEGIIATLILCLSLLTAAHKYFVILPNSTDGREAYAEDMVTMAERIKVLPQNQEVILIAGEYGTKTVKYLTHGVQRSIKRCELSDIDKINLNSQSAIFVQKDWIEESLSSFGDRNLNLELTPVFSDLDGRVLFYEKI